MQQSIAEPRSPDAATHEDASASSYVFWRVEGSLLNLTAVRPVGFFAWNAQSFLGRWARRGAMGAMAIARPFLYATHRVMATRLLHSVLRKVSKDRLDLLGEEYFQYVLHQRLKPAGLKQLKEAQWRGQKIVLVSQGLEQIMRPLAEHLGVDYLVCNRLEFRDGIATGRLLDPVIRPRGALAKVSGNQPDGRIDATQLTKNLGFGADLDRLHGAIRPVKHAHSTRALPTVHFPGELHPAELSVRESLRGKTILLIGATGFIGKVWLVNLLLDLPEIKKLYLLIRRHKSISPQQRFQRIVDQSPVFDPLAARHGDRLQEFLKQHIEIIEGDVTEPALGVDSATQQRLASEVDVMVNSSGLTEFNPDLREALSSNVTAVSYLLDFLATCRHASLLHLSTCYVAGRRDGRIVEKLTPNYTPIGVKDFNARIEWQSLEALIRHTEQRATQPEITEELTRQARVSKHAAKDLHGVALDNQIRKNRSRWVRQTLTDAGTRRADELGWPNTYTFTKSLAESLIHDFIAAHPQIRVAVVRPSIVESSLEKPFTGWNEGINTSASLSYLLGTFFRQLPTNERKCLDIVPVDLVCRAMTLISAALTQRVNENVYQIASSVSNPCDMRRSIELTGLGHRKYYRSCEGIERLKLRFDAIPVSKRRYEAFSAPAQKAVVQAINRTVEPFAFVKPPLARQERDLERVIKLVSLFEPFILHNDHTFEARNVERLSEALPPEELADFGYDALAVDWWDYWINVHIPALRKWCYPLIEGRTPEVSARWNHNGAGSDSESRSNRANGATRAAPAS
jgi:thioester reductase-like protein